MYIVYIHVPRNTPSAAIKPKKNFISRTVNSKFTHTYIQFAQLYICVKVYMMNEGIYNISIDDGGTKSTRGKNFFYTFITPTYNPYLCSTE